VASLLAADAQLMAGTPPTIAMWPNSFSPGPKLGKQMGELVQEGSIDFITAMVNEQRVQPDRFRLVIGPAGAAP
jgi:hypothetical protein